MSGREQGSPGFTLIEMVAVVGLFGLLIAIAVPTVAVTLRSTRLTGASNLLVADMYQTRALAKAQRSTYEIRFSSDRYSVMRLSPEQTVTTRILPKGVTCAASDTASFYGWGLTAPVTVTMNNTQRAETVRLAANGNISR